MLINKVWQALIASSIVFGALTMPMHADARGWQQWVQQGASIVRRGAQYRNEAAGYPSEGSYHQSTPQPPQAPPAPSESPGSNYYNIDPSTMRHPLKHADPEPAQEQPAYTPPSRSYSSRSAYHTGSDDSSGTPQQTNMPAYNSSSKVHLHAHAAKHVERLERAVVVVPHKESTKPVVEKPEVLTPITAFDTSWITPTLDRIEAKLRKGLN